MVCINNHRYKTVRTLQRLLTLLQSLPDEDVIEITFDRAIVWRCANLRRLIDQFIRFDFEQTPFICEFRLVDEVWTASDDCHKSLMMFDAFMSMEGHRGIGQWIDGGDGSDNVRVGRVSYVF